MEPPDASPARVIVAARVNATGPVLAGIITGAAANMCINNATARVTGSPPRCMIRPRSSPPPHCMRKVRERSSAEHTERGVTFDHRLNRTAEQPRALRIRKRA